MASRMRAFDTVRDQGVAAKILKEGIEILDDRAAQYEKDPKRGERSMDRIVSAFNALTKHNLSVADGWLFMAVLKLGRDQTSGKAKLDTYVDGANYIALRREQRLEDE